MRHYSTTTHFTAPKLKKKTFRFHEQLKRKLRFPVKSLIGPILWMSSFHLAYSTITWLPVRLSSESWSLQKITTNFSNAEAFLKTCYPSHGIWRNRDTVLLWRTESIVLKCCHNVCFNSWRTHVLFSLNLNMDSNRL